MAHHPLPLVLLLILLSLFNLHVSGFDLWLGRRRKRRTRKRRGRRRKRRRSRRRRRRKKKKKKKKKTGEKETKEKEKKGRHEKLETRSRRRFTAYVLHQVHSSSSSSSSSSRKRTHKPSRGVAGRRSGNLSQNDHTYLMMQTKLALTCQQTCPDSTRLPWLHAVPRRLFCRLSSSSLSLCLALLPERKRKRRGKQKETPALWCLLKEAGRKCLLAVWSRLLVVASPLLGGPGNCVKPNRGGMIGALNSIGPPPPPSPTPSLTGHSSFLLVEWEGRGRKGRRQKCLISLVTLQRIWTF